MINKAKACCFTGHRVIPKTEYNNIEKTLKRLIAILVNRGIIYYYVGGALGFDTLVARTIISMKKYYNDIRLISVLPCKNQTKGWHKNDIDMYYYIIEHSDDIIYTAEYYSKDSMFKRNRYLVDNSNLCICYSTRNFGGTYYTINYAKSTGIKVINIANL